jgi:type III restriction enzyme
MYSLLIPIVTQRAGRVSVPGDFRKHYHRQVGELGDKGEEFECALFIDQLPGVETWVRNLERQPERSFWLPTATDRFYPDFVCKLKDGRILGNRIQGL